MEPPSGWRAKRVTALAVAAAFVLAACPSSDPRPGPTAPPSATRPARGGTVTVAYPSEPATLDPFELAGDAPATRDIVRLVMPAFARLGPDAAERWLLAEEPTTEGDPPTAMTVKLRDDAVWSDGTPITVADLIATWRRVRAAAPSIADGYDRIAAIERLDDKRARIRFTRPFRRAGALFAGGLGVIPAHVKSYATWRVAGGPFVVTKWNRGLDITLERNPRAWGGEPNLDRIRIVFVPSADGALELMRRGEVDVLGPYTAPDWKRRAAAVGAVSADRGETWAALLLNTAAAPLDELAVRRALQLGIDRRRLGALVDGEPHGTLDPGDGVVAPAAARRDDAARALETAGWRGSPSRRKGSARLTFTIAYVGSEPVAGLLARAIQFQAAEIGMHVELVGLESSIFWREWLSGSRFRSALMVWRDPPGGAVRARFGLYDAKRSNRARLRDASLLRALDAADRSTTSDDASIAGARIPAIPLAVLDVTLVVRAGTVCGVHASAAADGPFWNAERWSRAPCA